MTNKVMIDMWYGDKFSDCDKYDWSFSDIDCIYRGNLYSNGKTVGDFSCSRIQDFERIWNNELEAAEKARSY